MRHCEEEGDECLLETRPSTADAPAGEHADLELVLFLEVLDELLERDIALDLEAVPERVLGVAVLRRRRVRGIRGEGAT